jgi:uncharacterized protein (DUF342 family)
LEQEKAELKAENKELKEKLEEFAKELIQHHEEYKNMADMVVELQKENRTLKEEFEQYKQNYNIERDGQTKFLMFML